MVEHAIGLPTIEERTQCARAIVKQMETKVPQLRQNANYKQTLWDHLYMISQKRLDIEWPYDISNAERIHSKPEPMKLPQNRIRMRHYGRLVEELLDRLKEMPDGPERDELMKLTANQMKLDLVQWGHGSIDDEKVADDMARLTDGAVQLDLSSFKFNRVVMDEAPKGKKSKKRK